MPATARSKKTASRRKTPGRRKTAARGRKWSARVTRESDALTLDPGVFTSGSAKQIAASLKRSAGRSRRRKAGPFQSAMSMLNFYINRGGRNLPASKKKTLNQAKAELRRLYGRA